MSATNECKFARKKKSASVKQQQQLQQLRWSSYDWQLRA